MTAYMNQQTYTAALQRLTQEGRMVGITIDADGVLCRVWTPPREKDALQESLVMCEGETLHEVIINAEALLLELLEEGRPDVETRRVG